MKALVGPFNQEKALVGAFSVIVKTDFETDGALHSTNCNELDHGPAAVHRTLYLVLTTARPSGDLAWTLPGHPARGLMKLTSFLDAADDGIIGQVRLYSVKLL